MRSVSVKELKDDPGRYLDEVLAGEEVLIEDQDQPVAKIITFSVDDEDDAYLMKLAAEGRARLPIEGGPIPLEFWEEPPFNVSAKDWWLW
jgi:antitoxin (DNA-binding transcriptional repressor) of toxin-antitoxin stability system